MTSLEKVEFLLKARSSRKPIMPFTDEEKNFSISQGYEIQNELLKRAEVNGEKLSGYKMGLTSKAKQKDVNVFEPIRGFLLKSMEIANEGTVELGSRIQPRVEPEIAVVTKSLLKGENLEVHEILKAVQGIYLACEIIDSRYEAYRFKLPDVIADNTSSSGYTLGKVNLLPHFKDLRLFGIALIANGEIMGTGAPAAALGDPILSLRELVTALTKEGKSLLEGHVVLTGGLTNSLPLKTGDQIEATCPFDRIKLKVR